MGAEWFDEHKPENWHRELAERSVDAAVPVVAEYYGTRAIEAAGRDAMSSRLVEAANRSVEDRARRAVAAEAALRDAQAEVERLGCIIRDWCGYGESLSEMRAELAEARATIQRVEAACEQVEGDDRESLNTYGQHMPGSIVVVAEMVRAALRGDRR